MSAVPKITDKITSPSPVYYKKFSARNFNTSPLTISGLKGDAYDYTLIISTPGTTTYTYNYLTANGDTTANYRDYGMRGRGSSAAATVNDSASRMDLFETGSSGNEEKLCIVKITGDSSDERFFDVFTNSNDNTNHSIWKKSLYWKDTSNELASITFTCGVSTTYDATIVLFATPKESTSENWTLIKKGSVSQNTVTTPFDITGLDGDNDKVYKLVIKNAYVNSTPDQWLRLNADGGINYVGEEIQNLNGSIAAQNLTSRTAITPMDSEGSTRKSENTFIIHAESGTKRLIESSCTMRNPPGGFYCQREGAWWWNNTVDNLTSIRLTLAASDTHNFDYEIYRIKNTNTVADRFNLPFKLLKKIDVSGDFSTGYTFSGLKGDSVLLYKLEWSGKIASGASSPVLEVKPNNDTTAANYIMQWLRATTSTANAADNTTEGRLSRHYLSTDYAHITLYIFPQSGEVRTCLSMSSMDSSQFYLESSWWTDTANEITSLKVNCTTTSSLTGPLKLSYIPLPEA